MARSDGARRWALLLSELAAVPVTVEWERPAWRVRWVDGPTRDDLMERAQALGEYRVGSPLRVGELRFARSSSAAAVALAWLVHGSDPGRDAVVLVEHACEQTGYPQLRADAAALAAADLLRRVGMAIPRRVRGEVTDGRRQHRHHGHHGPDNGPQQ